MGLIAVLGFACSDSGDDKPQAVTSTVLVSSGSPSPTGTLAASVSPTATVPADWATYTDPNGYFMFRYPHDWDLMQSSGEVRIASFKQSGWNGDFATGDVVIDFGEVPTSQLASKPAAARDEVLGGSAAWGFEQGPTGNGDATWKWEHWVGLVHAGQGYIIVAYFGDAKPDQTTADAVLGSVTFEG